MGLKNTYSNIIGKIFTSRVSGEVERLQYSLDSQLADIKQREIEIIEREAEIIEREAEIRATLHDMWWMIVNLDKQIVSQADRLDKIGDLRFIELYKKNNEEDLVARKRFFMSLPKATGKMRVLQLGNLKLLQEFDKICKEAKLTYWLDCGTLLGAIRHGGFIPWDDDIDVGMTRADINTLQTVIQNNKDYQLTLKYDYYCKSRQLRFCTRNKNNPCFVDVFYYDYAQGDLRENEKHQKEQRVEIMEQFKKLEDDELIKVWSEHGYIAADDKKYGPQLTNLFDEIFEPYLKNIPENGDNLLWGLDNMTPTLPGCFSINSVMPIKKVKFEGYILDCPKTPEDYTQRRYGNIYKFPQDIVSHFQHVDQTNLPVELIQSFIKQK